MFRSFGLILCLSVSPAAVDAQSPVINTFAGDGSTAFSGDNGPAIEAGLNVPVAVATAASGVVYIGDQFNNRIRLVDTGGTITTIAGTGPASFSGDGGPATQATLNTPTGVFVQPQGTLLIADVGNSRIRQIGLNGVITTVAGNGGQGYSGDNGPAIDATFYNPVRAISDAAGNIYIADQSNHRVRMVDTTGTVTTIAGTGVQSFSGDGGPATSAALNNPTSVALDGAGNLYICDQFNQRIRKVDTTGIITTIAGTGAQGYSGDGGLATNATLNYPGGMAIDSSGNIFFSDDSNFVVREIAPDQTITTVAGNGTAGFSGDGGPATSASLSGEFGLAIDPSGDLLIADSVNNRIRIVGKLSPVTPYLTSASVTNSASYASGGSAGQLETVFGVHLSVNLSGVVSATTVPLPLTLAGSSITVNGVPAPILAVANVNGSEQINFQMPWEAANQSTAQVVVDNGVSSNAAVPVQLTTAQPGVFNIGAGDGSIEHLDYTVVSAANPAQPGEYVIVYANGLGPVSPSLTDGAATPASPLSYTNGAVTVTVGGISANVLFSGAAPYFVGLNQINMQVPANAASGPQNLIVSVDGVASNTVIIEIQ
jgi:uncharacterized protein (TIGR03437 family)